MCRPLPDWEHTVTDERLAKADAALRNSFDRLSWEQASKVFEELGFLCHLRYQEDGSFGAELSDLQRVAAAAAMAAAAETGGKISERQSA